MTKLENLFATLLTMNPKVLGVIDVSVGLFVYALIGGFIFAVVPQFWLAISLYLFFLFLLEIRRFVSCFVECVHNVRKFVNYDEE